MKNKKLFIFICIPLIISIMVLPLCSFMPSVDDSSPSYDYSPSYGSNVDVGVDIRMYSKIEDFDYLFTGYIDDVLKCSLNYILNEPSDPTLYPNISYESAYVSSAYNSSILFYVDDLAADYVLPDGRWVVDYGISIEPTISFDEGSEYHTESFLNGNFNITYSPGEISDNDIMITFLSPSGDPLDLSNFNIQCDIMYVKKDSMQSYGNFSIDLSRLSYYLEALDPIYLNTYALASAILERTGVQFSSVESFNFTLLPLDTVTTRFSDYAGECYVYSQIMPVDYAESQYIDWVTTHNKDLYDKGYEIGYNIGFNSGVASDISPWEGISDFLKDTVGGFLDFEFVEGISFGGMLSLFLGIILVFTFLKIFAGG